MSDMPPILGSFRPPVTQTSPPPPDAEAPAADTGAPLNPDHQTARPAGKRGANQQGKKRGPYRKSTAAERFERTKTKKRSKSAAPNYAFDTKRIVSFSRAQAEASEAWSAIPEGVMYNHGPGTEVIAALQCVPILVLLPRDEPHIQFGFEQCEVHATFMHNDVSFSTITPVGKPAFFISGTRSETTHIHVRSDALYEFRASPLPAVGLPL